MIRPDLQRLSRRLGHLIANRALLEEALTHRSAAGQHNERLEFLGDSILNFVIAAELYRRHPKASEGELTRMRARLVREEALAELARELELSDYLRMGAGDLKSGSYRRDSVLADTLEALFAAVYLDAGLAVAQEVILRLYQAKLDLPAQSMEQLKDPKTRLQEWLQARQQPLPIYSILSAHGEDHCKLFMVECRVGQLSTTAEAHSRRRAEQEAARLALESLTS